MEPVRIERPAVPVVAVVQDSVWTRRSVWGSLVVGALVGFAITVVMGSFGAAVGLTAGAAAVEDREEYGRMDRPAERPAPAAVEPAPERPVDRTPADTVERRDNRMTRDRSPSASAPADRSPAAMGERKDRDRSPTAAAPQERTPDTREPVTGAPTRTDVDEDDAKAAGISGALWLVLTAILAGLAGGYVAGRISHDAGRDISLVGLGTWAIGIVILVSLMAFGVSSILGGVGAGAGEQVAHRGVDARTGETAMAAASTALWAFFIAQVLGLAATIIGAKTGVRRWFRRHRDEDVVVTTPALT